MRIEKQRGAVKTINVTLGQVNVRAAPYDFRYGANSPTGELFLQNLQQLIEDTYTQNNGRKVNVVAHRCGEIVYKLKSNIYDDIMFLITFGIIRASNLYRSYPWSMRSTHENCRLNLWLFSFQHGQSLHDPVFQTNEFKLEKEVHQTIHLHFRYSN